jgi:hypothetical protein
MDTQERLIQDFVSERDGDVKEIGKVCSPIEKGVKCKVGLSESSWNVYIEIEHSECKHSRGVIWLQVDNVNLAYPNQKSKVLEKAIEKAIEYLKTNDILNLKKYYDE